MLEISRVIPFTVTVYAGVWNGSEPRSPLGFYGHIQTFIYLQDNLAQSLGLNICICRSRNVLQELLKYEDEGKKIKNQQAVQTLSSHSTPAHQTRSQSVYMGRRSRKKGKGGGQHQWNCSLRCRTGSDGRA